jgi:aspartyl/asparaginyl beta-hydroxylase (cupin superfamily)
MTSYQHNHIWYASSMRPYPESEPWFYDAHKIPWAIDMEEHWDEYKDEIASFIKEKDDKFLSTSGFYKAIDLKNGWTTLAFLFWGVRISHEFDKKCPKMADHVRQIPGIVSVSMSRLAPRAQIAEHNGDTNAIMRCHFGVEVPASLPECGFKVNNESRNWEEGKFLVFNDAYRHSAWNNTDERRILIIIDVIRPEFIKSKNLVCAFILARHASYLYDKIGIVRIMPVFVKTIFFAVVLGAIYLGRPIYNLLKFK